MSDSSRRHTQGKVAGSPASLLHTLEQELQEGYFEVEITGLSLPRLVAVYTVLARNAWLAVLDNLRSLLRPTAAL